MAGKYTELWNKKKEESMSFEQDNDVSLPKLNWFKPNMAVKSSEKGTYMVRVLPVKTTGSWFVEFKKHSIKIGSAWKNAFCLDTKDKNDEPIGSCPICDFLHNEAEAIEGNNNVKQVRNRDAYSLVVFDYKEKTFLLYELNYYGFRDVLGAIVANEDPEFEESIDTEGFNLHFDTDDNGYARVMGVSKGKKTIEEILESVGVEDIPDAYNYAFPRNIKGTEKFLSDLLISVRKAGFFPEVESGDLPSKKKSSMVDDDDDFGMAKPSKSDKKAKKQEEEDEDFEEEEIEVPKSKSKAAKSEDEDEEVEEPKSEKKSSAKPKKTTVIDDEELNAILEDL